MDNFILSANSMGSTSLGTLDLNFISINYGEYGNKKALFNGSVARRPVSALWTANYTTSSSEAMNSGNRYYWKVCGLDGGGEQ